MLRKPCLVLSLSLLACGDSGQESASGSSSTSTPGETPADLTTTTAQPTTAGEGTSGGTMGGTQGESADPDTGPTPTTEMATSASSSSDPETTSAETTSTSSTSSTTTGGLADTGTDESSSSESTGEPIDVCKVNEMGDAVVECDEVAPPDSFEPEIQWTWTGQAEKYSIVTPLVANLTDDNGDGEIDLCDVPDVIVVASTSSGFPNFVGHIYVLDGATGALHFQIAAGIDHTVTPAIGDIDNDGLPEIVASVLGGNPIAFEHDGTQKWVSASNWPEAYSGSLALADADNDGDVEILGGNRLFDHNGVLLFAAPAPAATWSSSAFADLDGDGDQEVVLGHAAYHHTGAPLWVSPVQPGYPSIANLDADPEPEVLVTNAGGLALINHDGTIQYQNQRPTGDPQGGTTWLRPSTVHDFDGDDKSEYATSSANNYTVYNPTGPTIKWKAVVSDQSGIAAGTAFDFLGDGVAEAMYADEAYMFIFGENGQVLLQIPRTSGTLSEYPIVADIDKDGYAV